jgi:hypothetical protein
VAGHGASRRTQSIESIGGPSLDFLDHLMANNKQNIRWQKMEFLWLNK